MDRTAWIVVSLCTAGLLAWFFTQPKPVPSSAVQVVQAVKPDPAAPPPADGAAVAGAPPPGTPAEAGSPVPTAPESTFRIDADGIDYLFSSRGGGIKSATLPPHRFSGDTPTVLNDAAVGVVGALSRQPGEIDDGDYELTSPPGQTPVVFERTRPDGVVVRKTWTPVAEGAGKGFLWNLTVSFKNTGTATHQATWSLHTGTATPLQKNEEPVSACWNADGSAAQANASWFDGSGFLGMKFRQPAALLDKKFEKLLWAGVHSQYYATLIANTLPERELPAGGFWAQRHPYSLTLPDGTKFDTKAIHGGVSLPPLSLEPGQEKSFVFDVYMGPRAYSVLSKLDRRFGDAMFYGMFGFISKPMLGLLTWFERWLSFSTASWGLALILLTVLVRGIMWPLNLKATRQMKRMSMLAPQMKELQAKYKDDPAKMNSQVMGLYKKYGVNPVSGCLPMFLQIPIFFGLYTMLRNAVEMRGHGFWWVSDLALPDTQFHLWGFPVNPLPLVMAATMFVQMALTPKSPDPNMQAQQRIFMLMPVFFLFMCYNFAAALALYWTVSNIIGIIQSWVVKRMPEPELTERPAGPGEAPGGGKPGPGGKPSFMQIFADRLEAQQKKARARTSGSGPGAGGKSLRTGGGSGSALKKPGDR